MGCSARRRPSQEVVTPGVATHMVRRFALGFLSADGARDPKTLEGKIRPRLPLASSSENWPPHRCDMACAYILFVERWTAIAAARRAMTSPYILPKRTRFLALAPDVVQMTPWALGPCRHICDTLGCRPYDSRGPQARVVIYATHADVVHMAPTLAWPQSSFMRLGYSRHLCDYPGNLPNHVLRLRPTKPSP